MVLAIAVHLGGEVQQMDVQTSFPYADIDEKVFVEEPPGFKPQDENGGLLAIKLGKRLYGLAQSSGN